MKRILVFFVLLISGYLFGVSSSKKSPELHAMTSQFSFNNTVDSTDNAYDFTFPAVYVLVCNDDATISIYVDWLNGEASTDDFPILKEECLELDGRALLGGAVTGIHLEAASGTPAARILALR